MRVRNRLSADNGMGLYCDRAFTVFRVNLVRAGPEARAHSNQNNFRFTKNFTKYQQASR